MAVLQTTQIVLDSLDAGYAALLSAIQTKTASYLGYTPTHSVVDASHDSNLKIVTAIVPDDDRSGSLSSIHRDSLGTGVYVDEYRNATDWERRGLPYAGTAGRASFVWEHTYEANGVNDRFRIKRNFNPFLTASTVTVWKNGVKQVRNVDYVISNGSGQTAVNVILDVRMNTVPALGDLIKIHAEIREPITSVRYARPERIQSSIGGTWDNQTYGTENGMDYKNACSGAEEISALAGLPSTGLAVYWVGSQIQYGGNVLTIGVTLRDGTEAAPNYWFFDYPDHPGKRYMGIVLTPTASDNGDGTYTFTGGQTQDTNHGWLSDPGSGIEKELTRATTLAECQASEGTYFASTYGIAQSVTVHFWDGADPTNRVMQGGGGYQFNDGAATRIWNRYVNETCIPTMDADGNSPPQSHVMWLGGSRKHAVRGSRFLMKFDVKNNTATVTEGASGEYHCFDMFIQDMKLSRGLSGVYLIGQGSAQKQFRDVCIVNLDCRFIGGYSLLEFHQDGHGIGIQGVDNLIIAGYDGWECGGDINIYNIAGQTSVNCKGSDITINGTAAYFDNSGSKTNDIGIIVNGDGVSTDDKSKGEFIRIYVRDKDTGVADAWEDLTVWGDPLTAGDVDIDFTGTARSWQTNKKGFRPWRQTAGPISFNTKIRNLRAGSGLTRWLSVESIGTAGTDWIYDGDDAVFVGTATETKIVSTAYGSDTLALWQANSDTGNTYDPNSTIEAP